LCTFAALLSCRSQGHGQDTETDMAPFSSGTASNRIELPPPRAEGDVSLEAAIARRESLRTYADRAVDLASLGQLCWAAQGLTRDGSGRASPSAGATYPMEVYILTADGLFHYLPGEHALQRTDARDLRGPLATAALDQEAIRQAPAVFALVGVPSRTARRYGHRAWRYVFMEAGHVAQNILLQAEALGLGGVPIGAFDDAGCAGVLDLPADQQLLYIVPVGYPR
jgi:SagB-type dehydrogenase family enzyme